MRCKKNCANQRAGNAPRGEARPESHYYNERKNSRTFVCCENVADGQTRPKIVVMIVAMAFVSECDVPAKRESKKKQDTVRTPWRNVYPSQKRGVCVPTRPNPSRTVPTRPDETSRIGNKHPGANKADADARGSISSKANSAEYTRKGLVDGLLCPRGKKKAVPRSASL
ncbi:hypothetical protein P171DRAFT_87579 [Karstenula rhodostoma CBS 690.94]|uniref:Uncharacterized protein n=1 Tax=Karstenula rhodostoma CBS 690.94 TaxID=1392251 RepID=A0A9P4U8M3_9PLEO|nr:hypothetical protein P171DRAFT_87579 [Karstenula rhodostoma CBS 690.94]